MDTWKKKLKSKHDEEERRLYEGKKMKESGRMTHACKKTSNYHKNVIFDFFTFGYYYDHSRFTSSVSCKPFSKALSLISKQDNEAQVGVQRM